MSRASVVAIVQRAPDAVLQVVLAITETRHSQENRKKLFLKFSII